MEMIRNPAALQELMRNHDRAVSNLEVAEIFPKLRYRCLDNILIFEGIPGGMAALQRLYRDIQEPMMNAAQENLGPPNPFASLVSDNSTNAGKLTLLLQYKLTEILNCLLHLGSLSSTAGVENRDPLPNPWAPRTTGTTSTTRNASGTGQTPSQSNNPANSGKEHH